MMADYRAQPRKTNNSQIARLRMERGLTQCQLAEMVGVPQNNISRWENGTRNPSGQSLIRLAAALNCSIDEIVK